MLFTLENTARRLRLPISTLPYVHCTLLREETQIGFLHLGSRFHSTNCLINFRQSVRYGLTISILNEPIFARKKFLYILYISIKKRCSKEITRFWMHEYGIKCAYKLLSLQHSVKVVGKKVFFIIQHNETFSSQNFSLCTYCIHQSKSQSCLMRSFTEKFCLIFNSCISKEEVNNKQKCYCCSKQIITERKLLFSKFLHCFRYHH